MKRRGAVEAREVVRSSFLVGGDGGPGSGVERWKRGHWRGPEAEREGGCSWCASKGEWRRGRMGRGDIGQHPF
jgi:hypothetical protein